MRRIFHLSIISPSHAWLASALAANVPRMDTLACPPFSEGNDQIPQHSNLVYSLSAACPALDQIKNDLDAGRDIIIWNGLPGPQSYACFYQSLKANGLADLARISPCFIIGSPAAFLEYCCHCNGSLAAERIEKSFAGITSIPKFLTVAIEEWGRENVVLLEDPAVGSSRANAMRLGEKLLSACGHEWPGVQPHGVGHGAYFNNADAVRILQGMSVRGNAWPQLDEQAFLDTLGRLDHEWGFTPWLPLDFRKAHRTSLERLGAEMESLLGFAPGSLRDPDGYWLEESAAGGLPLPTDKLEQFAALLPQEVAEPLLARYVNDSHLLEEDQKALQTALQKKDSFSHIGAVSEMPTLTVLTMTRDHEKYIAQCMDSVLEQKTNFPVRHIVLDHYSKDGTQDIINSYAAKYPSIKLVLFKDYLQTKSNVYELLHRCRSEYAALCDGDDYFCSPHKLQKQVDFLRDNPQYSLVFHPVAVTFEDGRATAVFPGPSLLPRGIRKTYYLADLVKGNFIQTNSVVYRWRFREGLPEWFNCEVCPGDWYWHLLHAERGKIGFLPEIMSVYRRHANALFVDSFRDPLKHRQKLGMAELNAYHVYNEHFQGRYFQPLARLAANVFANYLEIGMQTKDTSLFDAAVTGYPDFARYFVKNYCRKTREV